IYDSGHRRGSSVPRCVGEGTRQAVKDFSVYCPKAFAGIGSLPDTIDSRSIHIRMQRKKKTEQVERFRPRLVNEEANRLRAQLAAWCEAHTPELADAWPKLPDELTDRQQDSWEPMLAIADLAGGDWPARAREAAVTLASASISEDALGVLALEHLRDALGDDDRITTRHLLDVLTARDDAPWAEWWGPQVRDDHTQGPAARLSKILKEFGVKPKTIKLADSSTAKGFLRADLADAFERYLDGSTAVVSAPFPPVESRNLVTLRPVGYDVTSSNGGERARGEPQNGASLLGQKPPPENTRPCSKCKAPTFGEDGLCGRCRDESPA
ncbi:MAG: DUF3631 domain-containing protein, partial [Actinobacteria bacterium]|nr:DUF3631 domain-containing protein [Actinomycetota bacterium]